MKRLLIVLALIASCAEPPPQVDRLEESAILSPPLPEQLLRQPADFRIFDPVTQKEYFIYSYADASFQEDVVTVVDRGLPPAEQTTRLVKSGHPEHQAALRLFDTEWRSRDDEGKLKYLRGLVAREELRRVRPIEEQIRLTREVEQDLNEQKLSLQADLDSRRDTGAFQEGSDKHGLAPAPFIAGQIKLKERQILLCRARLLILEQERALRGAHP